MLQTHFCIRILFTVINPSRLRTALLITRRAEWRQNVRD